MSFNFWSTAISLYNSTKIKQLFLLTLREVGSMLIVIAGATALLLLNLFLKMPYLNAFVLAGILFYAVLTTRASVGLKNLAYYFRYSWLFIIALILVIFAEFVHVYSRFLAAFVILISIFALLRMADICFKRTISVEDFLVPFKSLYILVQGIPVIFPVFCVLALVLFAAMYVPYAIILLPLLLSFLVVWCANWYIIALYEQG